MDQIYYTQCPMGYGLGAASGFQIKRRSPGYPAAADVRHLAFRAFLPGTRRLAPITLRYRQVEGHAEIARLTPRSFEYETERGLWGRPGGHFAHGLRMDESELAALEHWPGGLLESPDWRVADPEPSRGRTPDEFTAGGIARPSLDALGSRLDLEAEQLATLLALVARVVRDGRTLYVVDAGESIAARVAALTAAFPSRMCAAITFSTYHDRPEELLGFRVQGTIPEARPNLAALASLGPVIDLRTLPPESELPAWARSMAGWITDSNPDAVAAWGRLGALAGRVTLDGVPDDAWEDGWLDHLVGLAASVGRDPLPVDDRDWRAWRERAEWCARGALGDAWAAAHPLGWWRGLSVDQRDRPAAFDGLMVQLGRGGPWSDRRAAFDWGLVAGTAARTAAPRERMSRLTQLIPMIPEGSRGGFVNGLMRGVGAAAFGELIRPLLSLTELAGSRLELTGRWLAAQFLASGRLTDMVAQMERHASHPARLARLLDALADENEEIGGEIGPFANLIAEVFERWDSAGRVAVVDWAIRRERGGAAWLGPALRRLFATPDLIDEWRDLAAGADPRGWDRLVDILLKIADDDSLPAEAFCWVVEEGLLRGDEAAADSPIVAAESYLARNRSPHDLARRLEGPRGRRLAHWLGRAEEAGALSEDARDSLGSGRALRQAMKAGDAGRLAHVDLRDVPGVDRPAAIERLIREVARGSMESLRLVLNSCGAAWPKTFRQPASTLGPIANPLVEAWADLVVSPNAWLDRAGWTLACLGVPEDRGPTGFLAALLDAATHRATSGMRAWPLRQFIFEREEDWRILGSDLCSDFASSSVDQAERIAAEWDRRIDKRQDPARFWELVLNTADGPRRAAIVLSRVADLKTLPRRLPWWDRPADAADDQRDAFARTAPMDPPPADQALAVHRWLFDVKSRLPIDNSDARLAVEPEQPTADGETAAPAVTDAGRLRWAALRTLAAMHRDQLPAGTRWQVIEEQIGRRLPLGRLPIEDRWRFVAWLIHDLAYPRPTSVDRLASWLVNDADLTQPDRLVEWAAMLGESATFGAESRTELVSVLRDEMRRCLREERTSSRRPRA